MTDSDPDGWLRLAATPGVGAILAHRLLDRFGLPAHIFAAPVAELAQCVGPALAAHLLTAPDAGQQDLIARARAWAAQPGHHLLTLIDPRYPAQLLEIADPPLVLYAVGRIDLLAAPQWALVGSRRATPHGLRHARQFALALAQAGLTITSGLAHGIDGAAHAGALEGAGSTVAVIGTGCDLCYPPAHRDLARRIAEDGLIVSELPPGTPPAAGNFPRRNRIIAGLARGVLVVEAAARSGSLITARLAAEQGREVGALPGSPTAMLARGCHQLIKDGAALVEEPADILALLGWPAARHGAPQPGAVATTPALDGTAARLFTLIGPDPVGFDQLVVHSGLAPEGLAGHLLELELGERITRLPGARYQRLL